MNQKHMDEISLEIHKGLKITGGNALIKYIWDFIETKTHLQNKYTSRFTQPQCVLFNSQGQPPWTSLVTDCQIFPFLPKSSLDSKSTPQQGLDPVSCVVDETPSAQIL